MENLPFIQLRDTLRQLYRDNLIQELVNILRSNWFEERVYSGEMVADMFLFGPYHPPAVRNHLVDFTYRKSLREEELFLKVLIMRGQVETAAEEIQAQGVQLLQSPFWAGRSPATFVFKSLSPQNRLNMLNLLLAAGLDVGHRDDDNASLLQQLAFHISPNENAVEMARELVRVGHPVNDEDNLGVTIVQEAALNGKLLFTAYLIRVGGDVNAANFEGDTALHLAASNGHHQILSLLFYYNANVTNNVLGLTPFRCINQANQLDCQRAVIRMFTLTQNMNQAINTQDWHTIQNNIGLFNCTQELNLLHEIFFGNLTYLNILQNSNNLRRLSNLLRQPQLRQRYDDKVATVPNFGQNLNLIMHLALIVQSERDRVRIFVTQLFGQQLPEVALNILCQNLSLEDLPGA